MGACMSKKNVHQPIPSKRLTKNPAKDTSLLLDQWNERHIEILKVKFQESLQVGKGQKVKIQGLDKNAFMKVFADLRTFPKQVAESAFKLFDRDKSGFIDFREFCCGLSIICLSSNNEKIRFIFDLFDLDRDGYLNRQELRMLLETSVQSFRRFCNGPGDQFDKMWIDHNIKIILSDSMMSQGNSLSQSQNISAEQRIDFHSFRQWADYNLNMHHLLHTFELVPSPVRERKTVIEILSNYQRKHGDTMYALSFRWWDMWKTYTSQHFSTIDQNNFIDQIRAQASDDAQAPEFIKSFLLAYYEEQKESDINEAIQRNELADYNQQLMQLKKDQSKPILTPRSNLGGVNMSHALDQSKIDEQCDVDQSMALDSSRKMRTIKNQSQMNMKLKEKLTSKRSSNYTSSFVLKDEENNPLDRQTSNYHQFMKGSYLHSQQDSPKDLKQRGDLMKFNSVASHGTIHQKRDSQVGLSKLKQIQTKEHDISMLPINSEPSQEHDVESNLRFSQSQRQLPLVERPQEIDNSDIEGEHPGQLKPNLILHRDFVMIPEEAWKHFQQWYGGGPSFPRKVIINNMVPTIELYPPLITSLLAGTDGNPVQNSARSLFVSIAMKLSEVFLKVCESFNYISTKDTRLWFKEGGQDWILIEKSELEKSLDEFIVKDGDVFMVEVKFGDKWPRDNEVQATLQRDWRNFEVGDKVDVFENNEWKIGRVDRVFKDKVKIHLENESWKNDIFIPRDSDMIAQYGSHTFEMHFKNSNLLSGEKLPSNVVGIDNIGNTCYMNAVLQALLHTPLLKEYFLNKGYLQTLANKLKQEQSQKQLQAVSNTTPGQKKQSVNTSQASQQNTQTVNQPSCVAAALGELFLEAFSGKDKIQPITFKKIISQELPMFFGNQQHDSQEFLSFLLDKISEDLNRIDEDEEDDLRQSLVFAQDMTQLQHASAPMAPQVNLIAENRSEFAVSGSATPVTGPLTNMNQLDSNLQQMQPNIINASPFEEQVQEYNDGGTGSAKVNQDDPQIQTINAHQNQANISPIDFNQRINSQNQSKELSLSINEAHNVTPNQNQHSIMSQGNIPNNVEENSNQNLLVLQQIPNKQKSFTITKGMTTSEQIYNSFFQPLNKQSGRGSPKKDQLMRYNDQSNQQQLLQASNRAALGNQTQLSSGARSSVGFKTQNVSPLLLNPNISEAERKAIEAWEREMKQQNSAISDLFVGQQATTVQCQNCRNKSYAFENFYTLSLPLPYNKMAIFYITVMKRSSQYAIAPTVKYGVQIDKNAKLIDLMEEVEKLSKLSSSKMMVVEVGNNKIYRSYDDPNINLNMIYRRTNELTIYEYINKIGEMPITNKQKQLLRGDSRKFKNIADIKQGQIIDAQDAYGKWYVGIVVDRDFDMDNHQYQVKVHFYEFPERWDEWFSQETIHKLAPFGTQADEPKEKVYTMHMTHRKVIVNEQQNLQEHLILGLPFIVTIGSWYTWEETYVEIINQACRYIKNMRIHGTKSVRSIKEENENISEDDVGEEKSSKIDKYDSSQFSKKMADVDKKGKPLATNKSHMRDEQRVHAFTLEHKYLKQPLSSKDLFVSSSPAKDVQENEIQLIIDKQQLRAQQHLPLIPQHAKSMTSRQKGVGNVTQKSYNDSVLQTLGEDLIVSQKKGFQGGYDGLTLTRLPFKVCILDAETHLCAICSFKSKYIEPRAKNTFPQMVTCRGCDIYQSSDKVKWILGCFKRFEICIEWEDPQLFKNPLVTSDMSCLKLLNQEKELKLGLPLGQCMDLYTTKEKIDDYECENCKKTTVAMVDTKISRAPDILIVHLKRFSYQAGYLEKIEDLVTFPVNNLDISNYVSPYKKKSSMHQYDLYAVVNHLMYHTTGGHYTAHILNEQSVSTNMNNSSASGMNKKFELWLRCNDQTIQRIEKQEIISKDAYILFYKRKEFTASNIINFTAPHY